MASLCGYYKLLRARQAWDDDYLRFLYIWFLPYIRPTSLTCDWSQAELVSFTTGWTTLVELMLCYLCHGRWDSAHPLQSMYNNPFHRCDSMPAYYYSRGQWNVLFVKLDWMISMSQRLYSDICVHCCGHRNCCHHKWWVSLEWHVILVEIILTGGFWTSAISVLRVYAINGRQLIIPLFVAISSIPTIIQIIVCCDISYAVITLNRLNVNTVWCYCHTSHRGIKPRMRHI